MEFGQRLKSLRIDRGYTQKELGRSIGVTEVTVGNWERGVKTPGLTALAALGKKLRVSLDVLAGADVSTIESIGGISTKSEKLLLDRYRQLDPLSRKAIDSLCEIEYERVSISKQENERRIRSIVPERKESERYIPFYTTPSAAGIAVPLEGDDFEMILADNSVPDDADYAVKIQGDSMYPYIDDGDMVFVKKDEPLSIGDVGIFCVDGAMYCKQYYRADNGTVYLLSANPDREYANIVLTPECGSTISSCGKVIMESIPLPAYFDE